MFGDGSQRGPNINIKYTVMANREDLNINIEYRVTATRGDLNINITYEVMAIRDKLTLKQIARQWLAERT
jgi:hypothetical protein